MPSNQKGNKQRTWTKLMWATADEKSYECKMQEMREDATKERAWS